MKCYGKFDDSRICDLCKKIDHIKYHNCLQATEERSQKTQQQIIDYFNEIDPRIYKENKV